jgi:hypothetical protein
MASEMEIVVDLVNPLRTVNWAWIEPDPIQQTRRRRRPRSGEKFRKTAARRRTGKARRTRSTIRIEKK